MVDCAYCGAKMNYLPFQCKYCGKKFCKDHRLPENHNCTLEYKENPIIAKNNLVPVESYQTTSQNASDYDSYNNYGQPYMGERNNRYSYHENQGNNLFSNLIGSNTPYLGTKILIVLNIISYILFLILSLNGNLKQYILLSFTDFSSPPFLFYTIITAMFVPDSIINLIINIFILYSFGRMIENQFDYKILLEIYFISGLITGIMTIVFQLIFGMIPIYSELLSPEFSGFSTEMGAILGVICFILILMLMMMPKTGVPLMPTMRIKPKTIIIAFFAFYLVFGIISQVIYTNPPVNGDYFPDFIIYYASVFGALGAYIKLKKMIQREYIQ